MDSIIKSRIFPQVLFSPVSFFILNALSFRGPTRYRRDSLFIGFSYSLNQGRKTEYRVFFVPLLTPKSLSLN